MNEDNPAQAKLRALLDKTRAEEMDCDEFFERASALADGTIQDEKLLALLQHHMDICPECGEHYQMLLRALGKETSNV